MINSPSELDLFRAELSGSALHDLFHAARRSAGLARMQLHGLPAYLVVHFADVKEFLADDQRFPGGTTYVHQVEPVVGRTFISMDGDAHKLQRLLATPAFRSNAVARFVEHALVPLAHELVDRFAARGSADLVAEFTDVLPYLAISRKLGLPVASERRQRRLARALLTYPIDPSGARAAAAELTQVIGAALAARRRNPGDDVLSRLLAAEVEGHHLDDEGIVSHVRLLFAVGATTTADAMSNLFWTLLTQPGLAERARREPALRPGIVHELLRWEPPVAALPRFTVAGGRIGGEDVPPGSLVLAALAAANRDPNVFDEPDRFLPERDEKEILTFGFGSKYCPGVNLARRQLLAALDVVLERLPDLRSAGRAAPSGGVLRSVKSLPVVWRLS
ncbi:MAG TPA: cytochrome P450 [Candidatus Margulisiibacteriota bacterium]|nr:cytochrome P450 [Candidatus Margulisiibacteriota bacterium]